MPTTFVFDGEEHMFEDDVMSFRCDAGECRESVTIGLPFCTAHTEKYLNLKIKPSGIPGAGLGVFAHCEAMPEGYPVFRRGYYIHPYYGENVGDDELYHRYGEHTAPYALGGEMRWGYPTNVDAALVRGIMAMVNHRPQGKDQNIQYVCGRRKDGGINCQAIKNIYHGQELFSSYGAQYFRNIGISSHRTITINDLKHEK